MLRLALATRGGLPHDSRDSRRECARDCDAAVEGNRGVAGVEGARASRCEEAADDELAVRSRSLGPLAVGADRDPDCMMPR